MRSFSLIEKHEYEHHWVLASEKPYESVYKFYPLQEVVHEHYSTPSPHTASVAARNASVWVRSQRIDTVPVQPNSALNFPLSGDFLFYHKGFYLDWISLYR